MATITLTKAKETVRSTIADELRHGILQFGELLSSKRNASAVVGTLSQDILESLLTNPESAKALLSLLETSPASTRDGNDWLKTEEVAKRMGFSRPYVVALIDAGEFGVGTSKSEKGHRRVKSSAVDQWIRDHRVVGSEKERLELLSRPDPAEFFENPILSRDEEAQLMKRIDEGKSESLKHRPVRKHA